MIPRELRSRELLWLLIAFALALAALTSVSFLADRLQQAFRYDARQLMAADFLIAADQPIPNVFLAEAQRQNLNTAQTTVFPSMATVAGLSKLASVKAVSIDYPLQGSLQIARQFQDGQVGESSLESVKHGPPSGSVWVDSGVLIALSAKLGDTLRLGEKNFRIDAVLVKELDRGAAFMNFAPRVMLSSDDLAATRLIGFGSRVTYRLLVSGSDSEVARFEQWTKQNIQSEQRRGMRIETLENAQPLMRKTIERAERFLSLVALMTAFIAAVAIGLASRRYVLKQADVCAVWKCFGASRKMILIRQIKTLSVLTALATLIGLILGWLTQELMLQSLGSLLLANLPAPSWMPLVWSLLIAVLLLIGFALPPLMTLIAISPMRLVRKEFGSLPLAGRWIAILGTLSVLSLLLWAARDWKLASWAALSFIGAAIIFAGVAWLLIRMIASERFADLLSRSGFAMRFAMGTQIRRVGFTMIQISALGISIMALLIIFLLRNDLLQAWQGNISADAPNRFVLNIQPEQRQAVFNELRASGLSHIELYPMVRGRLVEVNGRLVMPQDYRDENAQRLVDREFNLSYTDQLPKDNRIVSGQWFLNDDPQISLESGLAKTLGLKLGDQMTFEIAGQRLTAPITSLRKLNWGSMQVNFFVVMPPLTLSNLPQSWITSYHQPKSANPVDLKLSQSFTNLTIVDVANSLRQIQDVLDKLSGALGILMIFTLCAAVLVLFTALAATQDERFRDAALLKALGTSRSTLSALLMLELATLGALAGLLGGLAAGAAAWALGRYVLEIDFYSFGLSILLGVLIGTLVSVAAGYRFQRKVQTTSAMECLREA